MAAIVEVVEQPTDPLGGASGTKKILNVRFIAKANNAAFPYTIANEVIATALGEALGLRIAPVFVHVLAGEPHVAVQESDKVPAPTDLLVNHIHENQDVIHGAIVFDLFVANNDRALGPMRRNLLIDSTDKLVLHDQGNALFYRPRPGTVEAGIPRLDAVERGLEALFDMAHKNNRYWEFLTDEAATKRWCTRTRSSQTSSSKPLLRASRHNSNYRRLLNAIV